MEIAADINEKRFLLEEERKKTWLAKFQTKSIFNDFLIYDELINQEEMWKASGKEHEPVIYWLLEEHLSLRTYISKFYLAMREKYPFSQIQKHKERYLKVLEPCVDVSYIVENIFIYIRAMFYVVNRTAMINIDNEKKEEVYRHFLKDIKYLSTFKADFPEKSSIKVLYDYLIQFEDKELTDSEWENIDWQAMSMAIEGKLVTEIPTDRPMTELCYMEGRITVDMLPSSVGRKWM